MSLLELYAVGDICLQTKGAVHPFRNMMEIFKNRDILFGNLEVVLSDEGKKAKKAFVLNAPPENVKFLKEAQFNVLNIANNHILDLGVSGFRNTIDLLKENNLRFIGAGSDSSVSNFLIVEKNGLKIGFVGYTRGRFRVPEGILINKIKEEKIVKDIKDLKEKCDHVVVSLHWGIENVFYPSPDQIALAHSLIDNGAILILGHHPHVIQGIEKYKGGLISYSLGNFQFDSETFQETIILKVVFNERGIENYNIIPVVIDENSVPVKAEEHNSKKILDLVSRISEPLISGGVDTGWWYSEIAPEYLSDNIKSYMIRIKRYGITHAIECAVWLITPFCLKCYFGLIRQRYLKR